MIPTTKGYTEIVKIAEAALNGDKEKARKFMQAYLIKYPVGEFVYPFTHLLNGENDPAGFRKNMSLEQSSDITDG